MLPALTGLLVMLPNSCVAGTSYPAVVIPDYKVGLAPINGLSGLASPEAACSAWRASWVVGDIAERSWQSATANVGDEYAGQAVTWICMMQSTPEHLYHPLESHAPVYATYACGPNSSSNASLPWKCDCAPGFESVANSACVREASKNISRDVPTEDMCFTRGNPVVPGTGEKIQNEPDLEFGFDNGLRFERQYRSRRIGNTDPALGGLPDPAAVVAGMDLVWSHNWAIVLSVASKTVTFSDGARLTLTPGAGSGTWYADGHRYEMTLINGQYRLNDHRVGRVVLFDATGKAVSVQSPAGLAYQLTYIGARLQKVTDPFGRSLNFSYLNDRLERVETSGGESVAYQYDSAGRLVRVVRADGAARSYVYDDVQFPKALTAIVDERGNEFARFSYDSLARATSTQRATGVQKYLFSYLNDSVTVTHPLGEVERFDITSLAQSGKRAVLQASRTTPYVQASKARTWDAFSESLASDVDARGVTTRYTNDAHGLRASTVEASGTSIERATATTYSTQFPHLPATYTEPGRKTTWTYDSRGNPQTQVVVDTATGAARTQRWTYHPNGLLATRTGVSGATTSYQWDASGNLTRVTNPLGHQTSYAYDAAGRLVTESDPRKLVTRYQYDGRGRVTYVTRGTELTAYRWDGAGLLTSVTLPNQRTLTYTYDAAQRLTRVQDNLGNSIAYTLDAMGNRTREQVFDPANVLVRLRQWTYDALNRLEGEVGGATPSTQVTQHTFDLNANPITTTAPLGRTTSRTYDSLNRLTQVRDAAAGVTKFDYDAQDNITRVTDPKSLETRYTYNGFGDVRTQISPDTGTSTYTYDNGGRLATRTDARGVTATYSWDALDRLTKIVYPDETVVYTYDSCSYGVGELCSVKDNSGTTRFTYTPDGRIASKTQTANSPAPVIEQTISYKYDAYGQLLAMMTPKGTVVQYANAFGRVINISVGGTPLLKDATYAPFGPVTGWTWGNDQAGIPNKHARTYDLDGRLTRATSGSVIDPLELAYDAASRITGLQKWTGAAADPAKSIDYGYDALDRLTASTPGAGNPQLRQRYTYDATGNRTSRTTGTAVTAYGYEAASHRLKQLSGAENKTFIYDAVGNRLYDGKQRWAYGGNNRVTTIAIEGADPKSITTSINALGQRVAKTVNGVTTRYVYDEAGRLLGEYDSQGRMIQETLWLNDLPVGVMK